VTLEGELLEKSGAMTGGSLQPRAGQLSFGSSQEQDEAEPLRRRLLELGEALLACRRAEADLTTRLEHSRPELDGQQRQLEIGMALAGAPRLILFDEPAAGLSPAERRELVALLSSLPAHMSFVIIEHDLDIALRVSQRVTVMHNGRVLRHGTPAEIESDPQVQALYMGGRH
jgi:ABC-type uncharacterized transport system ATPase subunit